MICGLLQSFFNNMSTKLTFLCLETLLPRCELFTRICCQVHCFVNIRRRNKIYFGLLCPLRRNAAYFVQFTIIRNSIRHILKLSSNVYECLRATCNQRSTPATFFVYFGIRCFVAGCYIAQRLRYDKITEI